MKTQTIQERAAGELRAVCAAVRGLPGSAGTVSDICRASGLPRKLVVRRLRYHPSPLVPRYFVALDRPRTHGRSLTRWALTARGVEMAEGVVREQP